MSEPRGIERYEFVRELGTGGMGTVFEARDRATGARLAIKSLHGSGGATVYQFKQEFRLVSELSHPSLVRFGELFEDAGRFYLTMELVEGQTFLDFVRPGRREAETALEARSCIDDSATRRRPTPRCKTRPRRGPTAKRAIVRFLRPRTRVTSTPTASVSRSRSFAAASSRSTRSASSTAT